MPRIAITRLVDRELPVNSFVPRLRRSYIEVPLTVAEFEQTVPVLEKMEASGLLSFKVIENASVNPEAQLLTLHDLVQEDNFSLSMAYSGVITTGGNFERVFGITSQTSPMLRGTFDIMQAQIILNEPYASSYVQLRDENNNALSSQLSTANSGAKSIPFSSFPRVDATTGLRIFKSNPNIQGLYWILARRIA